MKSKEGQIKTPIPVKKSWGFCSLWEKKMKGELIMKREKKIINLMILTSLIFFLIPSFSFCISWFEKEKEVPDEYLTKLFAPGFPYESIKVMEDSQARRFIVIKTKDKMEGKTLRGYDDLLLSRGVSIYGTFHYGMFSWQKTVTDYAITITRKVEREPDIIEISESVVRNPEKNEPIVAASAKGKEIRIAIEKDFGKRWKKIVIVPEKEPELKEPTMWRYSGSHLMLIRDWTPITGKGRTLIFVSNDSLKRIYEYYLEKVGQSFIKASEDPFAEEIFSNPRAFSHNPIKISGIRTIGRDFRIRGYDQIPPGKMGSIRIYISQSLDSNLSEFIQIDVGEN